MKIKHRTRQYRRDFTAIYECEFCGYVTGEINGYDDEYFHNEVIPEMECKECGEHSGQPTSEPFVPKGVVL